MKILRSQYPIKTTYFKKIVAILLGYFLLTTLSFADSNWASVAKRDLLAIHKLIRTQTPGAVDKKNPTYLEWMETGLSLSSNLADKVQTYKGYVFALDSYVNGFHDEHLQLKFKPLVADQALWPGFLLYFQNGQFYVSPYAWDSLNAATLPPIGAKLLRCDGLSPRVLMLHNIFPYEGNPHLEADWVANAPWLLIKDGNPWAEYPGHCLFVQDNKKYLLDLKWQPLSQQINPELAAYNYQPQFSVMPFGKEGIWVSIPSFNASKAESLAGLQALVKTAKQWRSNKLIVIDVRGNHGGNSAWGTQILAKLYGEAYFSWAQNRRPDHSYDEWRVSKENLNYLKLVDLPYLEKSSGKTGGVYKNLLSVVHLMEAALDKSKQPSLVPDVYLGPSARVVRRQVSPVQGKVIVVTDGRCGSSCLTFVGQALNLPEVLLLGAPTHANSYYNELRFEKLPSGYAEFGFPMKVTRNRPRLTNQPYIPHYVFPGNINDTLELQKWILNKSSLDGA